MWARVRVSGLFDMAAFRAMLGSNHFRFVLVTHFLAAFTVTVPRRSLTLRLHCPRIARLATFLVHDFHFRRAFSTKRWPVLSSEFTCRERVV